MGKHNELREIYEFINMVRTALAKTGHTIPGDWLHEQRERIASINRHRIDPLSKPLTQEFRTIFDEEGGYTEYGIVEEDGTETTDEEIEEYIERCIKLPEINSPYDCTGQHFTRWVDYKRTPAGIAIVHSVGMDI